MFDTISALVPRDPAYADRTRTLDIFNRVLTGTLYDVLPYSFNAERGAGGGVYSASQPSSERALPFVSACRRGQCLAFVQRGALSGGRLSGRYGAADTGQFNQRGPSQCPNDRSGDPGFNRIGSCINAGLKGAGIF